MSMHLEHLIKKAAQRLMNLGQPVKSKKWQGLDLQHKMYQIIKVYLGPAIMPEFVSELESQCHPTNWAEKQFRERISGVPLNPGETYKDWPYYGNDKNMRNAKGVPEGDQKFTHTYMERFWPQHAGDIKRGDLTFTDVNPHGGDIEVLAQVKRGIRYEYGDLKSLIELLVNDPETRQAYLPIWFPEDTGAVHGGRVPCTLGYLFQIVNDKLHMTYYIRSCDLLRHFQDDVYMAVRLAQHIRKTLMMLSNDFRELEMGTFDMHIGSLHIFEQEKARVLRQFKITD